jgi:hypothetical protein
MKVEVEVEKGSVDARRLEKEKMQGRKGDLIEDGLMVGLARHHDSERFSGEG